MTGQSVPQTDVRMSQKLWRPHPGEGRGGIEGGHPRLLPGEVQELLLALEDAPWPEEVMEDDE